MYPVDLRQGLSIERLRQNLEYLPDTGEWIWLVSQSNRVQAGSRAGAVTSSGYWRVRFAGFGYLSARLAWFYMTEEWPKEQIDHINRDRLDDRWVNLRPATQSENMANRGMQINNTSGYKNISWNRDVKKWDVRVNKTPLGYFADIAEAIAVRDEYVDRWHGQFGTLINGGVKCI